MLINFKLIKLWFKEFYKRCPGQIRFRPEDPPLMIIGHRGAPAQAPENTIPSLDLALKEGANGLEIDLSLTKDNHVILWHDWDPNDTVAMLREAGFEPFVKYKPHPPAPFSKFRKPINLLTLQEIRDNYDYKKKKGKFHVVANAYIPTLEDFFKWTSNKPQVLYVFFDNKAPEADKGCAVEILDRIKELQQKYNPQFKIIIETAYVACLNEMKKKYPDLTYSLDIEPPAGIILEPKEYSSLDAAIKYNNEIAIVLRPRKITIANWTTYRRIIQVDTTKLRQFRNNGDDRLRLVAATVSKAKELRCLVRLGVDGIQTDFPGRLKRIARKYKRKTDVKESEEKIAV